MAVSAKICGISTLDSALVATDHGAKFLGFISFEKSPRHLSLSAAKKLGDQLKTLPLPDAGGPARVGVFVNADIDHIRDFAHALSLSHIQLHGSEGPDFAAQIKNELRLKVIKALAVSDKTDLAKIQPFVDTVDMFLFDAKPPKGSDLPGGNAVSLPWPLLQHIKTHRPWFVAGGIDEGNLNTAIRESGANYVDISSSVECAPGVKDTDKITRFLRACHLVP